MKERFKEEWFLRVIKRESEAWNLLPESPKLYNAYRKLMYHVIYLERRKESVIALLLLYTLFDWSRKLGRPSQPIRYKIKTNHDLIPRVFPRFRQFGCHYFEFSLAMTGILLSPDWPLLFITLVVVFRQLTSDPVLMTNNGSSPNQGNFLLILILN